MLRRPRRRVEVQLVELRGDPGVLPLALDTEREHADTVDLASVPQGLCPSEWEQAPAQVDQHLVVVRQRQRRADRLAVLLGYERPVLVEDRLEVLSVVADLV